MYLTLTIIWCLQLQYILMLLEQDRVLIYSTTQTSLLFCDVTRRDNYCNFNVFNHTKLNKLYQIFWRGRAHLFPFQ